MMKDRGYDYVFGRKEKRKRIRRITFLSGENTLGLDTWDISEAQDGSVLAHLKGNFGREKELFIWADGKITANKNCSRLFFGYENLEAIEGLENLETGLAEDMSEMFADCKSLRTLDVSHFDTSRVETMISMFNDCEELKELDLSHFDTSQVRDMKYMFADCSNLERLDLSNFEVKQIWTWDMEGMFSECDSLEELDISGFDERKNDGAFLRGLLIPYDTEVTC